MDAGLQNFLPQPAPKTDPAPVSKRSQFDKPSATPHKDFKDVMRSGADRSLPRSKVNERSLEKAAPKAAETYAQQKRSPASKKSESLKAIAGLIGKGYQATAKSPVLAMLTGKFEQLDPAGLPELVANNQFIQKALSEDPSKLLAESFSVRDLVKLFDLGSDVLQVASDQGLDIDEQIRVTDFLKTIGIDPHKIIVEINHLKEALPKEGLTKYIAKASVFGAKNQARGEAVNALEAQSPITAEEENKRKLGVQSAVAGATAAEALRANSPLKGGDIKLSSLSQKPALHAQGVPPTGAPQSLSMANGLNGGQHSAQFSGAGFSSQNTLTSDATHAGELSSKMQVDAATTVDGTFEKQVDSGVKLTAERVDHNPYERLSEQFSSKRVVDLSQTTTAASGQTKSSAQANSINEMLARMQFDKDALSKNGGVDVGLSEVKEDLASQLSPSSEASLDTNFVGASFKNGRLSETGKVDLTLSKDISNGITLDDGFVVERDLSERGFSEDFSDNLSGESREFSSFKSELKPNEAGLASTATFSQALKANESLATPEVDQTSAADKVIHKAQMLIKQGGGAVMVDLGSKELGQLALAVQVEGEQVSLRLLSSSDKVKSLLGADLAKLQESLASQNLQLVNVEMGSDQRSTFDQARSGNQWFDNQQFSQFKDQSSQNFNEPQTKFLGMAGSVFSDMRPERINLSRPLPSLHDNGRIQVLA